MANRKRYRIYIQYMGGIHKFSRNSYLNIKKKLKAKHEYDNLLEANNAIQKLWNADPNTQYILIDFGNDGKIVAINMPDNKSADVDIGMLEDDNW